MDLPWTLLSPGLNGQLATSFPSASVVDLPDWTCAVRRSGEHPGADNSFPTRLLLLTVVALGATMLTPSR
jgi:hypothetical protein